MFTLSMFTLSIGRRKPADDAQDTTAALAGLLKQTTDERDRFVAATERQLQELELRGHMISESERQVAIASEVIVSERQRFDEDQSESSTRFATGLARLRNENDQLRADLALLHEARAKDAETITLLRKWLAENSLVDPTAPTEDDSEVTEHEAGTQEPVTT